MDELFIWFLISLPINTIICSFRFICGCRTQENKRWDLWGEKCDRPIIAQWRQCLLSHDYLNVIFMFFFFYFLFFFFISNLLRRHWLLGGNAPDWNIHSCLFFHAYLFCNWWKHTKAWPTDPPLFSSTDHTETRFVVWLSRLGSRFGGLGLQSRHWVWRHPGFAGAGGGPRSLLPLLTWVLRDSCRGRRFKTWARETSTGRT